MKRLAPVLPGLLIAFAINLGVSVPASAAGTAPRASAPQAVKTALPPVMKGGKGNNNSSSTTPTRQSASSIASNVAAGTPTPSDVWATQNPGPDANPIFAISCPSAIECVTVGLGGILVTTNGGSTWTPTSTPGNLLTAVSCFDTNNCAAVGYNGVVFTTTTAATTANWSQSTIVGGVIFYGVSCPSNLQCVAVGQGGTIYSGMTPGGPWTVQTSNTTRDLFAVSCVGVVGTTCVAVGSGGQVVSLSGSTWTNNGNPTANALFGVSCLSSTTCDAVGQGGVVLNTISGPSSWFAGSVGSPAVSLSAVSCSSANSCHIAGTDGNVYVQKPTASGASFPGHGFISPGGALFGISCFSDTACYAAGDNGVVASTTNGGTGWTQQTGTTFSMYGETCPSTTVCYAVGFSGQIAATTNGGATWTAQTSNTPNALHSIACWTTAACIAVGDGGAVVATTTSGGTWTVETSNTTANLNSISCPAANICYAVPNGTADFITTTDGTHWTHGIAAGVVEFTAISCVSTTACFATVTSGPADTGVVETNDSGAHWNALTFDLPSDPDGGFQNGMTLLAIDCPTTSACYAVGSMGVIVATSDGGVNWRSDNPASAAGLTGVSCPSAGVCYASGQDSTVYTTSNAGAFWSAQFPGIASQPAYNDVACASTSTCVAVGSGGVVATTTTSGAAWTRVRPTGFGGGIHRMSCFGPANCYAVSPIGDILSTHNSGTTWTDHALGTGETPISISCPGTNTCYATGWPGAIDKTTDGGTTWLAQPNTYTGADRTLIGVSCADLTHCVAAGTDGIVLSTADGSTWATESLGPGVTTPMFDVSCPTASSCVLIGASSSIYTRSGGSWTARSSGTTKALHGVTCVSASTCYIVGASGTILVSTDSGASWTAQSSGTTSDLNSISCAQPGFCVAGGSFGTAIVTVDGATWKALNPAVVNTIHAVAFPDLDHVWLAGAGGLILADTSIFPSCRSVAIAPMVTSPQPVGTSVVFSAFPSGCPDDNPLLRFWIRDTGGTWHIAQDFSPSTIFNWDTSTYVPGTYLIGVWVLDQRSSFTYDAYAFGTFTIQEPPCTFVTVASDVGSPQNAGTTVHFTATLGGCPVPLYQWWVRDAAGNWNIAVPFGTGTGTFTWNTTGLTEGTYQIGIWIKEAHSSASYEAFAFVTYTLTVAGGHCSVPGLSPGVTTSPQVTGTPVTFTASATTCTSPLFRFWIRDLGGTWHIVRDFSATNTFTWNGSSGVPNTAPGTYLVGIWARAVGSTNTYDDFFFLTYTLTSGPTCSVNIAPSVPSGATTGTPVTWTATPTSCTALPQYRFWVNPPGGTWTIKQDYGTSNTFMWVPNAPGTYQVGVWIKQAGSTASYDNFAFTTFSVTNATPPAPCTDVEVGTAPASPQLANSGNVTLTATAQGCPSPQYRWWVRDLSANWSIVQDYPGSNTFMWNTNVPAGTYLLGVWVRNTGSTASYEAYSFITFTLTPNPPPQVCTSVNVAPDLASPQPPGTTVHFTATANGCNNPQYEFFVEPPGGSFAVAQAWSSSNTFTWNTSGLSPGPWAIGVWARQNGSSATYESFAFITYQLAAG